MRRLVVVHGARTKVGSNIPALFRARALLGICLLYRLQRVPVVPSDLTGIIEGSGTIGNSLVCQTQYTGTIQGSGTIGNRFTVYLVDYREFQ